MTPYPNTQLLLDKFHPAYLAEDYQPIARRFEIWANQIATDPQIVGPEETVCLRKLMEARDAAVMSVVASMRREERA